jgi:hypothetical protein
VYGGEYNLIVNMEINTTKQFYTIVNVWAKNRTFFLAMISGKLKRRGF